MNGEKPRPARPTARWTLLAPEPEIAKEIAGALGLSPITAQCLLNRGLRQPGLIRAFLASRLAQLADPFDIPDLAKTAQRLLLAKAKNERVLIFGDYDVDGISSVALLTELFKHFGIRSEFYLPHREDEGYGLSEGAVESALAEFPSEILLAIDCGSSSADIIHRVQARGIDVIVIDHHQPGDPAPKPLCFVNPHREAPGQTAFRELCSVGLAFKLAHGLVKPAREANHPEAACCDVRQWLDFAALGIVADLVPLTGENRIMLSAGLKRLNGSTRPGIAALIEVAGINREIGVSEIGFQIAPRLNAAGRLDSATQALRLLLNHDPKEAADLAFSLNEQNQLRQDIERGILAKALNKIRPTFDPATDWVIVEGEADWHIGVIGIVASRIMREFHRPAIILGGGPPWRGSGRSIAGFDLGAALQDCHELLLRHGGHAMAAGVTLDPATLEAFRSRLNGLAKTRLKPEDLLPALRLDVEVRLSDLSNEQIEDFELLAPFGQGHPPVQLFARKLRLNRPIMRMGTEGRHAKLWVNDGTGEAQTVYWNADANPLPSLEEEFDLAFVPGLNTFRGATQIQLRLLNWRKSVE